MPGSDPIPPKPVPPEKPLPWDCCESGCDPCVLDSYAEELAHYEQQLADWTRRYGPGEPPATSG